MLVSRRPNGNLAIPALAKGCNSCGENEETKALGGLNGANTKTSELVGDLHSFGPYLGIHIEYKGV